MDWSAGLARLHVARPRLDRRTYVASFGVKLVALRPLRTEEPYIWTSTGQLLMIESGECGRQQLKLFAIYYIVLLKNIPVLSNQT